MDSIALAYWKRPKYSITIDYGQKPAEAEKRSAAEISRFLGIENHIISIDCSSLGSGDLNGANPLSIAPISEWWPFRNQLLVTLACMKVISFGVTELLVGSVLTDSAHKDGTARFYDKISDLTRFQEGGLNVVTPAIQLSTIDLIKISNIPTSLLFWAHSCHTSNEPCMHCSGCKKYLYTLQGLGID